MVIYCRHCGSKARITSRNTLAAGVVDDLYCQCMNTRHCGASFVVTLSFKNYLNPPLTNVQQLAAHVLGNLSKAQRAELLQGDLFQ